MNIDVAIKIIESDRDEDYKFLSAMPLPMRKQSALADKIKAREEAIAALRRQVPKMPITYTQTNVADCPVCGATVRGISGPFGDYCSHCGQKIDWRAADKR